jgi:hypothetical protein
VNLQPTKPLSVAGLLNLSLPTFGGQSCTRRNLRANLHCQSFILFEIEDSSARLKELVGSENQWASKMSEGVPVEK